MGTASFLPVCCKAPVWSSLGPAHASAPGCPVWCASFNCGETQVCLGKALGLCIGMRNSA